MKNKYNNVLIFCIILAVTFGIFLWFSVTRGFHKDKELILRDKSGFVIDYYKEVYDYDVIGDSLIYIDYGNGLYKTVHIYPGEKLECHDYTPGF